MDVVQALQGNSYFFVMLFTVTYSLVFAFYLRTRYQQSRVIDRFLLFLCGVLLWSVKDALGEALLPLMADTPRLYAQVLALLSGLYLVGPLLGFDLLMSVYNASVSPSGRFRHTRQARIALVTVLGGIYVSAAVEPRTLYRTFMVTPYDYIYTAGPAMHVLTLVVLVAIAIPAFMLLRASWGRFHSEGFFIAVGAIGTLTILVSTNTLPSSWGQQEPPRLGCLSASLLCGLTFVGIVRHGGLFSLTRVLEERGKYRLIADGMEALIGEGEECAIYQMICNRAREISNSLASVIVFFLEGDRTYEVRVGAVRDSNAALLLERSLPFVQGTIYNVADVPGLRRQLGSTSAFTFSGTVEYFGSESPSQDSLEQLEQILSYPIVYEGAVRGALVLFRDQADESQELFRIFGIECSLVLRYSWQISELRKLRRLEEQLHRVQKMEAIGQLAGGMAHDFNNTLAGITGYAQLIKRRFGDVSPTIISYADTVISAARQSAGLVEKLLTFARKGKVQSILLDLNDVVHEAHQLFKPMLDSRVRITMQLQKDPVRLMGDPTQLQNVLVNLAINARNAMPQGGELDISTGTEHFSRVESFDNEFEIAPGTYAMLSVRDTGIGMDSQTRRRIFEPFFTTDTSGRGSGLGLASVYGTVKSHQGYITVASEKGEGTTFRILFPLQEQEPTPAVEGGAKSAGEHASRGHGHVLVVDDDELICRLSSEMLRYLGYTATAVSSGAEAVDYFRQNASNVDIAIIDIMMPVMDGYDTLHELRAIRSDVKVLLTTGYSLPRDTQYMAAAGLCGFIQKPFDSDTLAQTLYDTMHGELPARLRDAIASRERPNEQDS